MAAQFTILCVGQQSQLMNVRDAVLRMDGYAVIEAYTAEDGLRIFESSDVDLVMICHTIPAQQRRRLASVMKASRPLTPVIALHHAFDYVSEADISVDQLSGPEALLEAIASLLKKSVESTVLSARPHDAKVKAS